VAYEELKQRQSAVWGNGPYQRITETLRDIHELVVERLAPQPGKQWLDLACGTGAVAERAAALGASATPIDLAPALIETARARAAERGLDIDYRVGDCERLELADASFDAVSSTLGVMFAPDHEAVAGELARVTRELLGEAFELDLERHVSPFHAPSGEAYWELFSTSYGPTKTPAEALGDRREELHWAWVDFFESHHRTNGQIAHEREYLLVVGTRRER
jgi:ubiquinone/menaquinone biosynthesis C-methylase UbiE